MKIRTLAEIAATSGIAMVGVMGCGDGQSSPSTRPATVPRERCVLATDSSGHAVGSSEVHLGAIRYRGLRWLARGPVGLFGRKLVRDQVLVDQRGRRRVRDAGRRRSWPASRTRGRWSRCRRGRKVRRETQDLRVHKDHRECRDPRDRQGRRATQGLQGRKAPAGLPGLRARKGLPVRKDLPVRMVPRAHRVPRGSAAPGRTRS